MHQLCLYGILRELVVERHVVNGGLRLDQSDVNILTSEAILVLDMKGRIID